MLAEHARIGQVLGMPNYSAFRRIVAEAISRHGSPEQLSKVCGFSPKIVTPWR